MSSTENQPLYAAREPIFPRRVKGFYRNLKWWVMAVTLGIYYLTPWIRWDRGPNLPDQAVLVDMANRRFYFFWIEIWPHEFYFVAGLLVMAGLGLFLFTLRNGRLADLQRGGGMCYAEKLLISKNTDLNEALEDLKKTQAQLIDSEKMASLGQLTAGVAHEINNPLTTILTTAMLLQEDLEPADPQYEELDTIAKEALRCRKIVTSLLDFARQTKPTKKECDINVLIRESVALTRKQAAFKDVNLTHELADSIPAVFLDKGQIQQSMINLILNAIEATAPGGSITVISKLESENKNIEIAVIDTGHGISAEDLSKIFDPFFTTKEDGNGLGLAITHGIIEQHHGTIDVASKKGEGSTFKIKLPVKPGDENVA